METVVVVAIVRAMRPAKQERGHAGLAGQPPGLFCGEPIAGGGVGDADSVAELVEGGHHHHGGGGAAVLGEPVGGEVLQEGAERLAATAGWGSRSTSSPSGPPRGLRRGEV